MYLFQLRLLLQVGLLLSNFVNQLITLMALLVHVKFLQFIFILVSNTVIRAKTAVTNNLLYTIDFDEPNAYTMHYWFSVESFASGSYVIVEGPF